MQSVIYDGDMKIARTKYGQFIKGKKQDVGDSVARKILKIPGFRTTTIMPRDKKTRTTRAPIVHRHKKPRSTRAPIVARHKKARTRRVLIVARDKKPRTKRTLRISGKIHEYKRGIAMSYIRFPTLFECKKTGKVSHSQVEILPQTLTLDPHFSAKWHPRNSNTLFKEITIVPPERVVTPEMRRLFKTRFGYSKIKSDAHYFGILFRYLCQIVIRNWKPKMFHVILHSSGFDSRMLSWVIKTLFNRYGKGWLGEVMFLCTKWEGAYFKQIMGYEGWNPHQYLVVGENRKRTEYYAPILLDFKNIWRHTNGAASKLNNLCWYLVDQAQKGGYIPEKDIQLFTGEWGNAIFDTASGSRANRALVNEWHRRYMSYPCSISYKCDELVQPFTNIGLARRVLVSMPRFGRKLRPKFLSWISPGLARIKRFHLTGEGSFPSGASWILSQLLENYNKSWYAKNVRGLSRLPSKNQHSDIWSYVSSASFCDYLLDHSYKIRIGR